MSASQVRLDELLARQIDVQWFEGVAIVQAVCRQLLATGASSDQFPGATQIGVCADGSILVLDTTSTRAVPAAAHLLAGLMSDDVPVRLRLAVSQATGEGSAIPGLREFSETLAYFERPDSELVVRNLFDRAMLAGFRKEADRPRFEEVRTEEKRETPAKAPRATKAMVRRAAIAAAVVIGMGATSWLVLSAARGGRASAAFSGIANPFAGAPEARPEQPLENPSASKETATKGTAAPQRAHSPTANNSNGRSGRVRKGSASALVAGIPSLVPSLISVMAPTPSRDASNATEPAATHLIVASDGNERGSDAVYSKSDSEVTPPRQVYPAMPAKPSPRIRTTDLTVLDLVVSTDGLVENVRMRTPPRDIHEFMLVSAAKAWRFEPATLDGRPVRFRHSVAITTD